MKKIYSIFMLLLVSIVMLACQTTSTNETTLSNDDILNLILQQVDIPEYIAEDIELPTSYTVDGYTAQASWRSTASSIIDSTGKIHANVSNQYATLILTLTYEDETSTKNFDVTILGDEDYLVLYVALSTLVNMPINEIDEDLDLPSEYTVEGKTVTAKWTSANEAIMTSAGKITMVDFSQEVELTVELTLNKAKMTETFTIKVAQNPATLPQNSYHLSPVYLGEIENEAVKPYTPSCFPGAIYRKVVSSKDYWIGIEATITLPEFIPDPERYDSSVMSYYLDNSSIYMGGNAYYESDVGIAWSIGLPSEDSTTVSKKGIAFRPFWRYITNTEGCKNNNCYKNANVRDFEYYYFPGDTLRMSVYSPKAGYLELRIELISETTNPDYSTRRADYGLTGDFNKVFVSTMFPAAGMGEYPAEFKRVNAIDQVRNEAKPTLNTNAQVNDAIWHEVYLYRDIDGELYKVPLTEERSASMTCPLGSNVNGDFTDAFEISYEGVNKSLGGEVVTLNPNNGTGRLYNVAAIIDKKKENLLIEGD